MSPSKKGYVLLEMLVSATILLLFVPLIGRMAVSSEKLLKKTSFSFQTRTFLERKAYLHISSSDTEEAAGGYLFIDNAEYIWKKDIQVLDAEKGLYTVMFSITSPAEDQTYGLSFIQKL